MNAIKQELEGKTVLLLGFGREGSSTLEYIEKNKINVKEITIAAQDEITRTHKKEYATCIGKDYLNNISNYDIVFQSPGVSLKNKIQEECDLSNITSQTNMILKYYSDKIIGVTGTKGKSTTATMIYEILKQKYKTVLVGNIGTPAFSMIDEIEQADYVVYELSSHQLEFARYSPHIAIILNIYEEHLDHYIGFKQYMEAKKNIARYQKQGDLFIYNEAQSEEITNGISLKASCYPMTFDNAKLDIKATKEDLQYICGNHNLYNLSYAIKIAHMLDINERDILKGISSFRPLAHRLEYIGTKDDILFYDDSISTIPEATIQAIKSIQKVKTVLIGGMDRKISYEKIKEYILDNPTLSYILMYESGKRLYDELKKTNNIYLVDNLKQATELAKKITPKGSSCILSPAAASYGDFKNFEERGDIFKQYVFE